MNVVVLDGHGVNPGDLTWDDIRAGCGGGNVTVYDRTQPEETAQRIGQAEAVLTNKTALTEEVFARCPSLRYAGVLATGYNVVDIEAADRRGIAVTNVPGYSTSAVVQHLFALIFERTNAVRIHSESVHRGEWTACPDFCYWKTPLTEVAGKTLGIFGFGAIGQRVAAAALAFGMRVLVFTRTVEKIRSSGLDVRAAGWQEWLSSSDFLTLHAPLTKETEHIIDAAALSAMKPGAMLINTARGPLVDEYAVRQALDSGRLGAYAADVLSAEPPSGGNPLIGAPNCILTPHIAWAPEETRVRLLQIAGENLAAFLRGERRNRIV